MEDLNEIRERVLNRILFKLKNLEIDNIHTENHFVRIYLTDHSALTVCFGVGNKPASASLMHRGNLCYSAVNENELCRILEAVADLKQNANLFGMKRFLAETL